MLFVLMLFGALARKLKFLDVEAVKTLTAIVVNFTTPCIIIHSFQCPFDSARMPGLGWSVVMAAIWYSLGIVFSLIRFSGRDDANRALKWSVLFSNCGFMGLPLEYALFGADGVFYCVVPIAFFNLIAWTYGVTIFRPLNGRRDLITGVLNPANVSAIVALVLFLLPWRLPKVVDEPLRLVGEMNTVLPMFILGYYLVGAKFAEVFRRGGCYVMLALRHFAVPLLLTGALMLLPMIPAELKLIAIVPASAPVGVLLTVFAIKYGGDAEFSTAVVSASTLLSIMTIPIVVAIAKAFI